MSSAESIQREIASIDFALKAQGLPMYSAMRNQRDDMLAALRDIAERDWTYTGVDADIANPDSLYNRVARARLVIKEATS